LRFCAAKNVSGFSGPKFRAGLVASMGSMRA
jgi:hypothetical protein